ncbi:MAG: hypothetical protein WC801_05310 [Patescibacteria group bacterium]
MDVNLDIRYLIVNPPVPASPARRVKPGVNITNTRVYPGVLVSEFRLWTKS